MDSHEERIIVCSLQVEEAFDLSTLTERSKDMLEIPIRDLIVVRHGYYSDGGNDPGLCDRGRQEAQHLAAAIRTICGEMPITLLSSSASRASQTARIIGKVFGEKAPHETPDFWHDDNHRPNLERGMELILACTTPVVVVVAHADVTADLPWLFGKQVLDKKVNLPTTTYGEGWHLTVPDGTSAKIRQPSS